MTCCLPLSGCLVTDPVEFEQEENFPPSIESPAGMGVEHPLNEVIIFDLSEEGALEGDLPLDVLIRDPNVQQTLQYKFFVDNDPSDTARGEFPPEEGPDGTPSLVRRRELDDIQRMRFAEPGCHRIELRVTGEFDFRNPREPRPLPDGGAPEVKDIGTAVWWVFTREGPRDEVNPVLCPSM